jgi:hypothetical protein
MGPVELGRVGPLLILTYTSQVSQHIIVKG